jgi:hypothetical protein
MTKRTYDFIPAVLAGFCTTALLIGPFEAHAQTAAKPAFEIVRTGDRTMTCPALAAEINSLGQPQPAAEAKPKKRGGLGFLRTLGSAVPMVGGMGSGGALLSGVAGAASSLAMNSQVDSQMNDAQAMAREAMAGPTPAQQRKERLTAIFETKGC